MTTDRAGSHYVRIEALSPVLGAEAIVCGLRSSGMRDWGCGGAGLVCQIGKLSMAASL